MKASASVQVTVLAAVILSCNSAHDVCVMPPCPTPVAVIVTVTSSSATVPVSGAFVLAPGYGTASSCSGAPSATCYVFGSPGTYELDIGGPGFATVHRSVLVRGTDRGPCSCTEMETEHLNVALVPAL